MTQRQIDTPSTADAPLFAWLYPDGHQHRLTIGPHIDEPVATIDVQTYHQARELARVYDARPRNF